MGALFQVPTSAIAHLTIVSGGYRYWWTDAKGTRWSSGLIKTKQDAVHSMKERGFKRYRFGEKSVSIA